LQRRFRRLSHRRGNLGWCEFAARAFLDLACASDDDLRAEVERLLSADAANDTFLERPPYPAIAGAFPPIANLSLTSRILRDRYFVEERVTSGGQTIVYRATDRVLSRTVVIKVMRSSREQRAPVGAVRT
jgi:hypothetical protein